MSELEIVTLIVSERIVVEAETSDWRNDETVPFVYSF